MSLQFAVYDMAGRHFSSLFDPRLLACSPPMYICRRCGGHVAHIGETRTHSKFGTEEASLDDTYGLTLSLDKFVDAKWICVDAGLTALW